MNVTIIGKPWNVAVPGANGYFYLLHSAGYRAGHTQLLFVVLFMIVDFLSFLCGPWRTFVGQPVGISLHPRNLGKLPSSRVHDLRELTTYAPFPCRWLVQYWRFGMFHWSTHWHTNTNTHTHIFPHRRNPTRTWTLHTDHSLKVTIKTNLSFILSFIKSYHKDESFGRALAPRTELNL